jgi:hypothetical protein
MATGRISVVRICNFTCLLLTVEAFCDPGPSNIFMVQYATMSKEQLTIWTNAYNAALIGLLSSKMHVMERFTGNNVKVVTDQCIAFADQALRDVLAHEQND